MYTFSHRRVKKLIPVWMYNPPGQEFKKEIPDKAFLESTISVLMPARLFHPLFQIRKSPIHGQGAFSVRHIAKGTRIIEYVGERITHEAADARYRDDPIEILIPSCLRSMKIPSSMRRARATMRGISTTAAIRIVKPSPRTGESLLRLSAKSRSERNWFTTTSLNSNRTTRRDGENFTLAGVGRYLAGDRFYSKRCD